MQGHHASTWAAPVAYVVTTRDEGKYSGVSLDGLDYNLGVGPNARA